MNKSQPLQRNERGAGFVEILITLVIVSIGFFALARMQIEGMKFSQSSYHRAQAYFMANDIIDRMRSNLQGVNDGAYDNVSTVAGGTNPSCNINKCNPTQQAQQDLFEWSSALYPDGDALPLLPSSAKVPAMGEIIAHGNSEFTVQIEWSNGDVDDSEQVQFAFMTQSLGGI